MKSKRKSERKKKDEQTAWSILQDNFWNDNIARKAIRIYLKEL